MIWVISDKIGDILVNKYFFKIARDKVKKQVVSALYFFPISIRWIAFLK